MFIKRQIKIQLIEKIQRKEETIPYEVSQKTINRLKPIDRKRRHKVLNYRR